MGIKSNLKKAKSKIKIRFTINKFKKLAALTFLLFIAAVLPYTIRLVEKGKPAEQSKAAIPTKKIAVILMNWNHRGYLGAPAIPPSVTLPTKNEVLNFVSGSLNSWFNEASYGQLQWNATVFTDTNGAWYSYAGTTCNSPYDVVKTIAPALVKDKSLDMATYDAILVVIPSESKSDGIQYGCDYTFEGITYSSTYLTSAGSKVIPTSMVYANNWAKPTDFLHITAHELLHALGLGGHAEAFECGEKSIDIDSNCKETDTNGDYWDIMGANYQVASHPNAYRKALLGWIQPSAIQTVAQNGTYVLEPLESYPQGNPKALAIYRTGSNSKDPMYYLEFRQGSLFSKLDPGAEGAYLYVTHNDNSGMSYVIDGSPKSITGVQDFKDPAFKVGQTFSDPISKITIKPTQIVNGLLSVQVTFNDSQFSGLSLLRPPYDIKYYWNNCIDVSQPSLDFTWIGAKGNPPYSYQIEENKNPASYNPVNSSVANWKRCSQCTTSKCMSCFSNPPVVPGTTDVYNDGYCLGWAGTSYEETYWRINAKDVSGLIAHSAWSRIKLEPSPWPTQTPTPRPTLTPTLVPTESPTPSPRPTVVITITPTPTKVPITKVNVLINNTSMGNYDLGQSDSKRITYSGTDNGLVKIYSSNSTNIISSERINMLKNSIYTSYTEMLGIPASKLSDKYIFPWYNNTNLLDTELRVGNTGTTSTTITLTLAGTVQPTTYNLPGNKYITIALPGIDKGPLEVKSSNSVPIVASLRINLKNNTSYASYMELMGVSASSTASTKYIFPWYNNTGYLDSQLRFGNIGTTSTTVTVKIGGQTKGSYPLAKGTAFKVSYPSLDSGPVEVSSSGGVPIIASQRINLKANPTYSSYSEFMGLPGATLSDTRFIFPLYENSGNFDSQLRFGNVGNASTTVTIRIAGANQSQTYTLSPGQSTRASISGIKNGPIEVLSSGGVPIIASLRTNTKTNSSVLSFFEFMGMSSGTPIGMPGNQLNTTYRFPWYNSTGALDTQIRIGTP